MDRIHRVYQDLYSNTRAKKIPIQMSVTEPVVPLIREGSPMRISTVQVPPPIPSPPVNEIFRNYAGKQVYTERIPYEKSRLDYIQGGFIDLVPIERISKTSLEVTHHYNRIAYEKRIRRVYEGEAIKLTISPEEYFARYSHRDNRESRKYRTIFNERMY